MVVYFTAAERQHMNIETYQIVFTHEQATASIGTVKAKLSGKDHVVINQEKLQIKLDAEHIEHTTEN